MKLHSMFLLLAAVPLAAEPISVDGTICRMNRAVDRIIVATDAGPRVRVAVTRSSPIRFNGRAYERNDLRPGDRVHLLGDRGGAHLVARHIDITMRAGDALIDSIFRSHHTMVGRFGVREAKSEFFMLMLPENNHLRIDAKAAYGPKGRVRVSSLRPGDLLEIRGTWASKDLLHASSIEVITDREPSFCRTAAKRGEINPETAAREADEQKFLDHADESSR